MGLVTFLREELVGDPHLDVVGLAGEYEKRLVLRFPAEAGDRPIVCAAVCRAADDRVRVTGDAQPRLHGGVGLHILQDRRVGDRLDEPSAKHGRRNAENDVAISALAGDWISSWSKIWLDDVAARRLSASSDDEEVVHAAVGRSVGIPLEAGFTDRAIARDEPWQPIFRPIEFGDRDQGIRRRAGPADGGLQVAGRTLVGVEAWPQPVVVTSGDDLNVLKSGEPILEELGLVRRKARQGSPGRRRLAAHAWIDAPCRRWSPQSSCDCADENSKCKYPQHDY